jgi:hypothetical protein
MNVDQRCVLCASCCFVNGLTFLLSKWRCVYRKFLLAFNGLSDDMTDRENSSELALWEPQSLQPLHYSCSNQCSQHTQHNLHNYYSTWIHKPLFNSCQWGALSMSTDNKVAYLRNIVIELSWVYLTADNQSTSSSWYRAAFGTHDQILSLSFH